MKTILILRDRPSSPMFYFIDHFVSRWEDAGYRVIDHIGSVDVPKADICILHINLTVIPPEYVEIIAKFPLVINGNILDISRRTFSQILLSKNDDYTGPVIVKTNTNYGGKPESDRLKQKYMLNEPSKSIFPSFGIKSVVKKSLFQLMNRTGIKKPFQKWDQIETMNPLTYPIFRNMNHVPKGVWGNPNLVVERFINSCKDGLYYAYYCVFFGDRQIGGRLASPNPIVKFSNLVSEERLAVPDAVRQWRKDLNIDFGRLDYLEFEGQYFLIDVNKTEGGGIEMGYEYPEEIDYLAGGLEYCLDFELEDL